MTVQELMDALNKVEDKSKDVIHYNDMEIAETEIVAIEEHYNEVVLY